MNTDYIWLILGAVGLALMSIFHIDARNRQKPKRKRKLYKSDGEIVLFVPDIYEGGNNKYIYRDGVIRKKVKNKSDYVDVEYRFKPEDVEIEDLEYCVVVRGVGTKTRFYVKGTTPLSRDMNFTVEEKVVKENAEIGEGVLDI